jgi:predicted MFS family arabinose efflux permease
MTSTGSRAWRVLLLLFAINLLNYIDRYVLAGVLPLIEQAFPGISKERLGWLAPAFLIVYMLTSPVFGFLGDRMTRKFLVGLGVQLWSLATAAAGLARSFTELFVSRMFVGVGEAAYGTTAPTIIGDLYPKSSRGRALAVFYVAIPAGSALGYLLGGMIGANWSWRAAFWVVGLPGLLIGLAAYFIHEPMRGATEDVDEQELKRFLKRKPRLRDFLGLFRIKSFVFNTLGMTAYTYSIGGIAYWMPTFLHQERHIPLAKANFQFGLVTVVTGIVGTLAGGQIADRLAKRIRGAYFLVCGVSMLLAAPAFYVALINPTPSIYWTALVVTELFLFVNTGPGNTILVNVTLPDVRTTAFAVNIFIIHALGDVLSPVIMGATADRSSLRHAFVQTGGVVVLSGLLWAAGTPFLGRDTDRIKEQMEARVRPESTSP